MLSYTRIDINIEVSKNGVRVQCQPLRIQFTQRRRQVRFSTSKTQAHYDQPIGNSLSCSAHSCAWPSLALSKHSQAEHAGEMSKLTMRYLLQDLGSHVHRRAAAVRQQAAYTNKHHKREH
jgi:hypothetical protein